MILVRITGEIKLPGPAQGSEVRKRKYKEWTGRNKDVIFTDNMTLYCI